MSCGSTPTFHGHFLHWRCGFFTAQPCNTYGLALKSVIFDVQIPKGHIFPSNVTERQPLPPSKKGQARLPQSKPRPVHSRTNTPRPPAKHVDGCGVCAPLPLLRTQEQAETWGRAAWQAAARRLAWQLALILASPPALSWLESLQPSHKRRHGEKQASVPSERQGRAP